jgi:hypothetical protein
VNISLLVDYYGFIIVLHLLLNDDKQGYTLNLKKADGVSIERGDVRCGKPQCPPPSE